MKRDILIVNDEKEVGGVSTVLENILSQLDYDKYNVDLFIFQNTGDMLCNIDKRINVIFGGKSFYGIDTSFRSSIKEHHFFRAFKKAIFVILAKFNLISFFFKYIRKKKLNKQYDVEVAFKTGYPTLFTGSGNSKKKITWVHGDLMRDNDMKHYSKTFSKCLNSIDIIVNLSEELKLNFIQLYGNAEKCIVIHNLLDYEKVLKKSTEKSNVLFKNNVINLIAVGRLHFNKGYIRLIEALSMVAKKTNKFHLYIVGDGPERETLQKKIIAENLNDYITLLGYSSNPYKYMKNADLFVCSSLTEAYPMVFVEVLTLNVPIFTVKIAAADYILCHEKYGYIVDNSTEAIYEGLLDIIETGCVKKIPQYDYVSANKEIVKKINNLFDEENYEEKNKN